MSDAQASLMQVPVPKLPRPRLVAALAVLVMLALPMAWGLACIPGQTLQGGTIELAAGMTAQQFAQQLHAGNGLTTPVWVLRWYIRAAGDAARLRAGEYRVAGGETVGHLLGRVVRGDVVQRRVALIEGWTFRRVLAQLHRTPKLKANLATLSDAEIRARLGITEGSLEGVFLPATYAYVAGMADSDVLNIARDRLRATLAVEWGRRAAGLPYTRAYDALIVASLVEKETGKAADRDAIAAVFAERLRLGMRLQTDPSVIYALGARFDGNLTRENLTLDDPYNTYVYAGLPPSPIALVSRAALHATLHPRQSDDLYFVARGDGSSEFSSTLAAHEQAVTRYQRSSGARRARDHEAAP